MPAAGVAVWVDPACGIGGSGGQEGRDVGLEALGPVVSLSVVTENQEVGRLAHEVNEGGIRGSVLDACLGKLFVDAILGLLECEDGIREDLKEEKEREKCEVYFFIFFFSFYNLSFIY